MSSLRRRLLISLLILPPLCAIPGAYWLYINTVRVTGQTFDYELIAITRALNGLSIEQIDRGKPLDDGEDDDVCIQLWDQNRRLLYHSDDEIAPFPVKDSGLETLSSPTGPWRSYTLTSHGISLQVAQPQEARKEMALRSAVRLLAPLLLILPMWAIFAWYAITRGLKPLSDIAGWLSHREAHTMAPLPLGGVPQEVVPMVRALNDLFYRLNAAFATQRTFIADAAHSLKTPLAVLRIQLEQARNAGNDKDRGVALAALSQGIERASRLIQQLLTLAKQEPNAPPSEPAQTVALDAVLREVVAEAVPLAQTRNIDLGVAEAEPVHLSIDVVGVRALLANLIDNAVRYSHPGGRIDASIAAEGSAARIEIIDDGPGIPLEERARVFDRFYRGADAAGTGSGLGLAIAAEIAHRHGGNISLENGFATSAAGEARMGLKVVVRLGELKR